MTRLPRNQILHGDATAVMQTLPSGSVDQIVTSPPYFRLRDYQVSGQLGLEPTVDDWVSNLLPVATQAARVLTPTGTLWLNLGDSFSTHTREGAERKSLLLAPERVALALVEQGWILRNKIVWAKTNTTPTSVRDRLATKYEVIYLFAREPRYYFDLDQIRQPHTSRPPKRRDAPRPKRARPRWLGPNSDGDGGLAALHAAGLRGHPLGKNPGDVWSIGVSSYRGAHFATYPPALVQRMLLAGCPERRCQRCRAPWIARVIRNGAQAERAPPGPSCDCNAPPEPGLVLDPFMGAGTTALVARELGRDYFGIELNPDFVALATKRLEGDNNNHERKEVT